MVDPGRARAYYAMARDGFVLQSSGQTKRQTRAAVGFDCPGHLVGFADSPTHHKARCCGQHHGYGNLYGNLLDYVISARAYFYILTIAGIFRLRQTRPMLNARTKHLVTP